MSQAGSYKEITQSAYLAYAANINHLLPKFDNLSQTEQTAWEAAVRQVETCIENRSASDQLDLTPR